MPAPRHSAEPDLGVDDPRRPASWLVPIGVRTASEWSWRVLVIAIGIMAVLWGLAQLSTIVVPVVVAVLLAALLWPVTRVLSRVMPRGAAAGLTVIGTLAAISGLLSFVGTQFSSQLPGITSQVGQGYDQIRAWFKQTFRLSDTQFDTYLQRARDELSKSSGNIGDTATQAGLTAGHVVAGFFLALFTLFFFLYEGEKIWAWVVRLFPRDARPKVHSSGRIAWGQLSAFTHATAAVAAFDAVFIAIGAWILGVPFALGVGVLVFFGAFVPIIGALVTGAVPVLLALVTLGPVQALIMLAIVVVVMQLESHALQPLIMGRAVRVHPLSVILGIAAGVLVAGVVGALIAVPLVAVVNSVGHHLLDAKPPPPERAEDMLDDAEQAQVERDVAEEEQIAEDKMAEQAISEDLVRDSDEGTSS